MTAEIVNHLISEFILVHDGKNRIEWSMDEFSDTCSDGDLLINNVLEILNKENISTIEKSEKLTETLTKYGSNSNYIMNNVLLTRLNIYKQGKESNPGWAT